MGQAGFHPRLWSLGADGWSVLSMGAHGVYSRMAVARTIPLGTLGEAVIPKGMTAKGKPDSRISFVAHLGYDVRASAGVRVLYADSQGVFGRGVVSHHDVKWHPGKYGATSEIVDLHRLYKHDALLSTGWTYIGK